MALWEYKIISSGKGGFGSPALLETHLNQLGKDDWEIIAFHTQPDNPLAFQGLARRTTQRDWTLEDAAAAAAKAEAEKLRAEFAAKFQAAQSSAPAATAEDKQTSLVAEAAGGGDDFRRVRDTDRDQDPEEVADDENEEWKKLESEQELPSFFEFIRPHMRRNQRGPGMSLAVDYLANKIDLTPADILTALRECDFVIPEREDDDPVYLEYDGDLYWVNVNRHHQLFINTKEKPRPVFRTVKGQPVAAPEKPADDQGGRQDDRGGRQQDRGGRQDGGGRRSRDDAASSAESPAPAPAEASAAAPATASGQGGATAEAGEGDDAPDTTPEPEATGPAADLLRRLRPMMRRNRRSPGVSGSISFLSRALKQSEQDFTATLVSVGFILPTGPNDKPAALDVGNWAYWLNQDGRGGLWINGRKRSDRDRGASTPATSNSADAPAAEAAPSGAASVSDVVAPAVEPSAAVALADSAASAPAAPAVSSVSSVAPLSGEALLADLRARLEAKPRGGAAASIADLASATGRSESDLLAALAASGLAAPAEPGDKSDSIDVAEDQFWLEKGAKDGVVRLQAKAKAKAKRKAASSEEESAAPADGAEAKRPARKLTKKSAKN